MMLTKMKIKHYQSQLSTISNKLRLYASYTFLFLSEGKQTYISLLSNVYSHVWCIVHIPKIEFEKTKTFPVKQPVQIINIFLD